MIEEGIQQAFHRSDWVYWISRYFAFNTISLIGCCEKFPDPINNIIVVLNFLQSLQFSCANMFVC